MQFNPDGCRSWIVRVRIEASERNHLVRRVRGQRAVEVREAAYGHAREQLVRDLPLVAALVAAHEQDTLLLGHPVQALPEGVVPDQDVVVVLEKEHAHHVRAVAILLELGQDHLGEDVRDRVTLGGEDVGDLHDEPPSCVVADRGDRVAFRIADRSARTHSAARSHLAGDTSGRSRTRSPGWTRIASRSVIPVTRSASSSQYATSATHVLARNLTCWMRAFPTLKLKWTEIPRASEQVAPATSRSGPRLRCSPRSKQLLTVMRRVSPQQGDSPCSSPMRCPRSCPDSTREERRREEAERKKLVRGHDRRRLRTRRTLCGRPSMAGPKGKGA